MTDVEEQCQVIYFPTVPATSLLGKALNYTLGQWPRLIRYLDDGLLRMEPEPGSVPITVQA